MGSRKDALENFDIKSDIPFYESIAKLIPNYVTEASRGTFKLTVNLPRNAKNPIAVLAQNGVDFQDNVFDTKAYQYWVEIGNDGHATIPRVKADKYRLTIYADGIFGQFTQDNITVDAGKTKTVCVRWEEENAGNELWRIGTPDKSSGGMLVTKLERK
jgi:rhamnogalacturonan endolyase